MRLSDRLWCWLVGLWMGYRYDADGHEWVDEEVDVPALVTTSRCTVCDETDTVWRRLP